MDFKVFLTVFMLCTTLVFGQKKRLDFKSDLDWPLLANQKISNDGRFVCYMVKTSNEIETIIQSTDLSKLYKLPSVDNLQFTDNSFNAIFRKGADSVGILNLKSGFTKFIDKVENFRMPKDSSNKWLPCLLNTPNKILVLHDLSTDKEVLFDNIINYEISDRGNRLVMIKKNGDKDSLSYNVLFYNTENGQTKSLYHGGEIVNIVLDNTGTQVAFIVKNNSPNAQDLKLNYYKIGMTSAIALDTCMAKHRAIFTLSGTLLYFNKSGDKLFFNVTKTGVDVEKKETRKAALVDLYHYKDAEMPSLTENLPPSLAVVNLNKNFQVIRLLQPEDMNGGYILNEESNNNYLLVYSNSKGNFSEYKWRQSAIPDLNIVSTETGNKKSIKKEFLGTGESFSGIGKYVIWFDRKQKNWFSYSISTGKTVNITEKIKSPLCEPNDHPDLQSPSGIAGWLKNDSAVLIYDRFDIWQVDPNGLRPPTNITNSYGAKNHIRLRLINFPKYENTIDFVRDTLLLSAFNIRNKENGFFTLNNDNNSNPVKVIMTARTYYFSYSSMQTVITGMEGQFKPVKAKYAKKYLLTIMSSTEYPNIFTTTNFKNFKAITHLSPEKYYNWYSTKLVHWKLFNGNIAEGVLYKPENFNPQKKYPIIFYYYEKNSEALNQFIHPLLSNGPINIPWYVSNGYLVFVPDIYYKIGHPGKSAYNSVVSAALYFSKKPWVNSSKMGLQGHSFGGFETNYIVSKTSLFSAAASASGLTNLISGYNQLSFKNRMQWYYENGQGRIGYTLWERPDLYIENSAIFRANRVTTPLLILHNKSELLVPFAQEAEWFSALSRLGKKVWMVSYDGEFHTLNQRENQLDYSTRLSQFFNFYLNDTPAPIWMTKGLPSSKKGQENGFELDLGVTP